jgi:hypothetical protein
MKWLTVFFSCENSSILKFVTHSPTKFRAWQLSEHPSYTASIRHFKRWAGQLSKRPSYTASIGTSKVCIKLLQKYTLKGVYQTRVKFYMQAILNPRTIVYKTKPD